MLIFTIFVSLLHTLTLSKLKPISIRDNNVELIPIDSFYFPPNGGIITFDNFSVNKSTKTPNTDYILYLITIDKQGFNKVEELLEDFSDSLIAHTLIKKTDYSLKKLKISASQIPPKQTIFVSSRKYVFIVLAQENNNPISLDFNLEMAYFTKQINETNFSTLKTDEQNKLKRFLSYEKVVNIHILFIFFFVFCGLLYFYVKYCKANKKHIKSIHYLIGLAVLTKAIVLLLESYYLDYLNKYDTHGFITFLYYFAKFGKTITLLLVVILLGSGWSYMKSVLNKEDKTILYTVLFIQIVLNIFYIIAEETNSSLEFKLGIEHAIFLADIVCFFLSVLPLQNTINNLKKSSHMDGKAVFNMARLKQFINFYSLIMIFLYSTRFIKYILTFIVGPRLMVITYFWKRLSETLFYYMIVKLFKPKKFVLDRKYIEDVELEDITEEDVEETKEILQSKNVTLETL